MSDFKDRFDKLIKNVSTIRTLVWLVAALASVIGIAIWALDYLTNDSAVGVHAIVYGLVACAAILVAINQLSIMQGSRAGTPQGAEITTTKITNSRQELRPETETLDDKKAKDRLAQFTRRFLNPALKEAHKRLIIVYEQSVKKTAPSAFQSVTWKEFQDVRRTPALLTLTETDAYKDKSLEDLETLLVKARKDLLRCVSYVDEYSLQHTEIKDELLKSGEWNKARDALRQAWTDFVHDPGFSILYKEIGNREGVWG